MGFLPAVSLDAQIGAPLILQVPAGANPVFGAQAIGDVNSRAELNADSSLVFGDGVNPPDTAIKRVSPGTVQFPGQVNVFGSVDIAATGAGLRVKAAANCKMGTGVLVAGTVTIANTSVTATSKIFLTDTSNGANLGVLSVGAINAGVSFVVNSSQGLDTGSFNYLIVEPG